MLAGMADADVVVMRLVNVVVVTGTDGMMSDNGMDGVGDVI